MVYSYHIWAAAFRFSVFSFDRGPKRFCRVVGDELCSTFQSLSHRRNIANLWLVYRCFHEKCDNVHWANTSSLAFYFFSKFHSELLQRGTDSRKECCNDHYNLYHFNFKINPFYLVYPHNMRPLLPHYTSLQLPHLVALYLEWYLGLICWRIIRNLRKWLYIYLYLN